MESESKLDNWIKTDWEQSKKEWEDSMEAKGFKPWLQLNEGETRFTIDRSKRPREIVGKRGGKIKVVELLVPADKVLGASKYLYSILIEQLSKQSSGEIRLLRTGQREDTKYKCLQV